MLLAGRSRSDTSYNEIDVDTDHENDTDALFEIVELCRAYLHQRAERDSEDAQLDVLGRINKSLRQEIFERQQRNKKPARFGSGQSNPNRRSLSPARSVSLGKRPFSLFHSASGETRQQELRADVLAANVTTTELTQPHVLATLNTRIKELAYILDRLRSLINATPRVSLRGDGPANVYQRAILEKITFELMEEMRILDDRRKKTDDILKPL